MVLFKHLKIILLQWFQFSAINGIQTDPLQKNSVYLKCFLSLSSSQFCLKHFVRYKWYGIPSDNLRWWEFQRSICLVMHFICIIWHHLIKRNNKHPQFYLYRFLACTLLLFQLICFEWFGLILFPAEFPSSFNITFVVDQYMQRALLML